MTTYNTYQEAKIANPESLICKFGDKFTIDASRFCQALQPCNHADYCMTVERFLADGYRFVDGDALLDVFGGLIVVGSEYSVPGANIKLDTDDRRYILRAAALEEKKPHTRVEYEKWNFECAWHAIKAFEDGERIYTKRSHKDYILIDNAPDVLRFLYDLHERIETPITWQEELYDYLDSSCEMSDDFDDSFTIGIEGKPLEFNLNDDEFVDMCKLVASLNSVN